MEKPLCIVFPTQLATETWYIKTKIYTFDNNVTVTVTPLPQNVYICSAYFVHNQNTYFQRFPQKYVRNKNELQKSVYFDILKENKLNQTFLKKICVSYDEYITSTLSPLKLCCFSKKNQILKLNLQWPLFSLHVLYIVMCLLLYIHIQSQILK